MFRKLVSNLPFSPALIHDVGFYAKRLRNEEATRRLTVLFVVLALVMQSLTMFSPPESANASSQQDIIPGGVSTLDDFLLRYDHNKDDLRDILNTLGITRAEVASAKPESLGSSSDTYIMTRYGQLTNASDEAAISYQRSVGGVDTRYMSPLSKMTTEHHSFSGWVGQSATIGWFGIVKNNGSIVTKGIPPTVRSEGLQATTVTRQIRAANLTQGSDNAANNLARPLDTIKYTMTVKNTSSTTTSATFNLQIADILEYSTLEDGGGGSLNNSTSTLSWPQVRLSAGETQERTFAIRLLAQIPQTPTGSSNPSSYDCSLTASFGENIRVPVDCPAIKAAEGIIGQLPTTGLSTNIIFATVLLIVATYFYARTRQMKREIRTIRHNLNTGII